MPDPEDLRDRLTLARAEGVGAVNYRRLIARFGSAGAAIAALPTLAKTMQSGGRRAPRLPNRADIDRELAAIDRAGCRLLMLDGPGYPPLLALLDDAPPALIVQGDPEILSARAVALVGGRNASANGRRIAEQLACELTEAGIVVVSGLARGVDSAAHEGALRTGLTVAAVAGGLDHPYPPENAGLQARIAASGAVVSEMPLGTQPQSRHFPRRNRIIAGLSLGVVVIEAAPRSGSLITARMAQETGREVFAVPGSPLDPRTRGSNDLIRQGATLTETAADVLDHLPDHPLRDGLARLPLFARPEPPLITAPAPPVEDAAMLESAQKTVLDLLGPAPTPVDEVVRRCHFSPSAVMAVLLELELAGRIEALPGNRVALIAG